MLHIKFEPNDHPGYELRVLLAEPLHRSEYKNTRYHVPGIDYTKYVRTINPSSPSSPPSSRKMGLRHRVLRTTASSVMTFESLFSYPLSLSLIIAIPDIFFKCTRARKPPAGPKCISLCVLVMVILRKVHDQILRAVLNE